MAESESNARDEERKASASGKTRPRAGAPAQDEAILYGDEGDLPKRRKKKGYGKETADKNAGTDSAFPNVTPGRHRKKTPHRTRQSQRQGLFDILSGNGNKEPSRPVVVLGWEVRLWPLVLLVFMIILINAIILNNGNLRTQEQTVTVVGLPEDLEGYRIIVLSDMNGRRFGDVQSLLLRTINGMHYDAIFCLGDMVGKDGDADPFFEFLDGLRYPDRVYFICGDSDPGPFVRTVRDIQGTLSQLVLEDWILGAIQRGAHYIDAPTTVTIRNTTIWLSPATMLNLEAMDTLESWKSQTEQEEDGVISGINEDYAALPITSYRYQLAQKLYEAQRTMSVSDLHITLAHERPSDEFLYTSQEHDSNSERYLAPPELLVAGHYCGGVWRLPFIGAIYVPDKTLPRGGWFPADASILGLSTVGSTQVFITGGLSNNGAVQLMPFRMFNGPQISIITLTATLPENMLEIE